MMDWVAVTALATIALVVVGYLQFRAFKAQAQSQSASSTSAPPVPALTYTIEKGTASYPVSNILQLSASDFADPSLYKLKRDLERITYGIVNIVNNNSTAVNRICLDLEGSIWSALVERTKILSTSAVRLTIGEQRLRIEIDELPAGDQIAIAVAGRYFSELMSSANAAIVLKNKWNYHA